MKSFSELMKRINEDANSVSKLKQKFAKERSKMKTPAVMVLANGNSELMDLAELSSSQLTAFKKQIKGMGGKLVPLD